MLEGWGGSREMFISYPKIVWHKYQKYRIQHFFVTFFFFFYSNAEEVYGKIVLLKLLDRG